MRTPTFLLSTALALPTLAEAQTETEAPVSESTAVEAYDVDNGFTAAWARVAFSVVGETL